MDQETLRRSQQLLQSLISDQHFRVGFLLDQHGRLITHVGDAASFSPQGKFTEVVDGKKEGGENVYMIGVEERFVLGVVFDEGINIEKVREVVEPHRGQFKTLLAPYFKRA